MYRNTKPATMRTSLHAADAALMRGNAGSAGAPETARHLPSSKTARRANRAVAIAPAERWPESFRGAICSREKIATRPGWLWSRHRIYRCRWRQPAANHASSIAGSGTIERLRPRRRKSERRRGGSRAAALRELQAKLRLPDLLEALAVQSWRCPKEFPQRRKTKRTQDTPQGP